MIGSINMDSIDDLLTRGVENIIPGKEKLAGVLRSGKKLNIYLGIDPTAVNIHIGHAVPLRKLQKFAELGHHVTFLIGDFTALIGDTSDKDSERPVLTETQIEDNFRTYKKQAEKILDFSKVTVRHNSEWLRPLAFADIVRLCQHFSAGDFVSRELIKKRLADGKHVGLHELLYPVMQGYDSYSMDTDIQLGGTDQTFNMQAGRTLQRDLRNKESYVIANGFLSGTDGRKMSKTWGNAIWLTDEPSDMFGKIMSLRDDLIGEYALLGTDMSLTEVESMKNRLTSGENPMAVKKDLALRIVTELHSAQAAGNARDAFERKFQKKDISEGDATVITLEGQTEMLPIDLLLACHAAESRSDARRLLQAGAVDINGTVITDISSVVKLSGKDNLKVGKKVFISVRTARG